MRRKKRWAVASLSVVLAAVGLSLLYAQQTRAVSNPYETFDENEMERYRVDIEQVTPDSGIESGFFIAYGHYLAPPYAVSVADGSTFVNGVQVYPPLQFPAVPKVSNRTTSPWWNEVRSISALADSATRVYRAELAADGDTTAAIAAASALLENSGLLDSTVWESRFTVALYGPPAPRDGQMTPMMAYSLDLPQQQPVDSAGEPSYEPRPESSLAAAMRAVLIDDGCYVVGPGLYGAYVQGESRAQAFLDVLDDSRLTPQEKWRQLQELRLATPAVAYCFSASFPAARDGWKSLRERLGSQP